MTRLRLDRVEKRYHGFAIDDVTLDLPPRSFTVLLGPSGSGKSTILRLVAGLERPDSGRVLLDERDVTQLPAEARGVGLVFQDGALFPHLDVAKNVEFGLRMRGAPKIERRARVHELLDLVGLAPLARRSVGRLSGGERQRVALARALAPRPGVLLYDEPLASLDRNLRDDLRRALRDVHDALGLTSVLVTHDRDEALALADRLVIVRDGKIVEEGATRDVFQRPRSAFTARLLGAATEVDGALVALDRVRFVPDESGNALVVDVRFAGFHDSARAARLADGSIVEANGPLGSFPAPGTRVRILSDGNASAAGSR